MSVGKKIGVVAGLIVLLIVLAMVALIVLVKPEQIKEMALDRVRESSGFEIEAGPASLHFGLSGVGVRVDSLMLASPDSLQVVGVEKVDVYAKLLPLLRRRVELKHLVVHRPVLRIRDPERVETPGPGAAQAQEAAPRALLAVESWSVKEGTYEHSGGWGELTLEGLDLQGDLAWDPERGASGSAGGSMKTGFVSGEAGDFDLPSAQVSTEIRFPARGDSILLPKIEVSSGRLKGLLSGAFGLTDVGWEGLIDGRVEPVSWNDVREFMPPDSLKKIEGFAIDGEFELKEIRIETRAASNKSLVSGILDFSDVSVKAPDAPLGFSEGKGTVRFSPGLVALENGTGKVGDDPVTFGLLVEGEKRRSLQASVATRFDAATLSHVLPEDSDLELDRGEVDVDVSISGALPFTTEEIPSITGKVNLINLFGTIMDLPLEDARGTIRFQGRRAEVEGLSASLGRSDFSLSGTVSDFSSPNLDFELQSNTLDLDEMFPKKEGDEAPGGAAEPKDQEVMGIPASGEITVRTLRYMKMEMQNARATLRVTPDGVFLEDVSAEMQEGEINGDLNLIPEDQGRAWQYAGRVNLNRVPVAVTLNAWSNLGQYIKGEANGDIDMQGRTAEGTDPLRDLTLGATFKVQNGAFVNVPGLQALGRTLRIKEAVEESWAFRNLSGAVSVREGRVIVDTLSVFQKDMEWSVAGSIGLDGSLELRGTLFADPEKLALPSEAELLKPYITNERGQVPVDFRMRGEFKSPDVSLDWESLLLRAAERAKKVEPEKLKDKIRETLKDPDALDKLKKLLGGGK
jgi:hypothetical protein